MSFKAVFTSRTHFDAAFTDPQRMTATFSPHIDVPVTDWYEGEYEITPGAVDQTIPILGKTASRNVTVHAIPQNYGLITWNGAFITVS